MAPTCPPRRPFSALSLTFAPILATGLLATALPTFGNHSGQGSDRRPWGGPGCSPRTELRQTVDDAFAAAPAADASGSGRGSGAAGYSVALSKNGCGVFLYNVGLRDVEAGKPMNRRTKQHLGSLTKVLTGTLAVRLAGVGLFGPQGLDATVDQFLTAEEIDRLSFGDDPNNPLCPADILAVNRLTGNLEPAVGLCPDFSLITLRHLLNGNNGLFDYYNEVDRNFNGLPDAGESPLGALFDAIGIPRQVLPEGTETAFDFLAVQGVLANPNAVIGGNSQTDFELTFGSTGHALFGLIAERVTGLTYNRLLRLAITAPLRTSRMFSLSAVPDPEGMIARQYLVTTGADQVGLPEDLFGIYPQVNIAGNPAINVYELESFLATSGGSAAGSVVATTASYRTFFDAVVEGRLLSTEEQALFDDSFVGITEMPGVSHGFGVFRFDDPEFGPGFAKSGRVTGSVCQLLHFDEPGSTVVACRNSFDAFLTPPLPPTSTPVADLARELIRVAGP